MTALDRSGRVQLAARIPLGTHSAALVVGLWVVRLVHHSLGMVVGVCRHHTTVPWMVIGWVLLTSTWVAHVEMMCGAAHI